MIAPHFNWIIMSNLKEKGRCEATPFFGKLLLSVHRALLAILTHALELDLTVDQSKQGVIAADTNIVTGMNVRASLANQDVASQNELTVSALHAQTLGLGVTAVLGGAAALLMGKELEADSQHVIAPP
jgi:hypothetical protein